MITLPKTLKTWYPKRKIYLPTIQFSEAMLVSGIVNRESLGLNPEISWSTPGFNAWNPMELAFEAALFLRSIPQVVPPPGQVGSWGCFKCLCRDDDDDDDDDDDILSCLPLDTPQNNLNIWTFWTPCCICSQNNAPLSWNIFPALLLLNSMIYLEKLPNLKPSLCPCVCFAIIHFFPQKTLSNKKEDVKN